MHEDVATEDERVAVDLRDDAATGSTDMSKEAMRLGVVAEAAEVEVANRWGLGFIQGRPFAVDVFNVVLGGVGVPGNSQAVHVEETVAHLEESILGVVELSFLSTGEKPGEVVFRALLGDGV